MISKYLHILLFHNDREMFPRFAISMEMTPKAFFKFWFVFYAHKLFLFSRLLFDIYLSTIGGFRTNHHQNILCSKFISQMTRFKIRTVHQELIAFFDRLDRKFCEYDFLFPQNICPTNVLRMSPRSFVMFLLIRLWPHRRFFIIPSGVVVVLGQRK